MSLFKKLCLGIIAGAFTLGLAACPEKKEEPTETTEPMMEATPEPPAEGGAMEETPPAEEPAH